MRRHRRCRPRRFRRSRPGRSGWGKTLLLGGAFLALLYAKGGGLPAPPPATHGHGLHPASFSPPLSPAAASGVACTWREPKRTYSGGESWRCVAVDWVDGDTLTARCDGRPGPVGVRLRGVDTDESGHARHGPAREELRRRTAGRTLAVAPHHHSHDRVVADVVAGGENVGAAMDAAGWSKADCPKR